jgi:hypothetical protein
MKKKRSGTLLDEPSYSLLGMRTHPTPPLTRLAAALGLGPGAAPGPSITDPTSPRGSGGSDGALPRPRSARRLGSTAAGGADAAPDTAKPSTSGRWALARWLPAVASLPPHAAVVAFCTAATVVAYIERAGFAIAYARAAGGGGSGGGVGHEGATGAVLAAFYWGYGLSQVREGEGRRGICAPHLAHFGGEVGATHSPSSDSDAHTSFQFHLSCS